MNINKIMANAGLAFFTTLAATTFTGDINGLATSAINALIVSGLAFFSEMKVECDDTSPPLVQAIKKSQKVAQAAVVW